MTPEGNIYYLICRLKACAAVLDADANTPGRLSKKAIRPHLEQLCHDARLLEIMLRPRTGGCVPVQPPAGRGCVPPTPPEGT